MYNVLLLVGRYISIISLVGPVPSQVQSAGASAGAWRADRASENRKGPAGDDILWMEEILHQKRQPLGNYETQGQ